LANTILCEYTEPLTKRAEKQTTAMSTICICDLLTTLLSQNTSTQLCSICTAARLHLLL